MKKSYRELLKLETFEERLMYLRLSQLAFETTFGLTRYLNQELYRSPIWKKTRQAIIIRDVGCDLGIKGREIHDKLVIHHINPLTLQDIETFAESILEIDNLILCSFVTHKEIHYGGNVSLPDVLTERRPFDHIPWR